MGKFIDNQEVAKRLKLIREGAGYKFMRRFALDADIDPSQYSKIEKAELGITPNILDKLVATYKVNADYVLYGEGDLGQNVPHEILHPIEELDILIALIIATLNMTEAEIEKRLQVEDGAILKIRNQKQVSGEFLHKIRIEFKDVLGGGNKTTLSDLYQLRRRLKKNTDDETDGIKFYESAPTYASFKTVYHDDPDHQVPDYIIRIPQFRDCNYGTRASGDSMYPEVRNGDQVICKELPVDARIIHGDMYIVHTKDGIETIKYIQQFIDDSADRPYVLLVPHNKAAGMGTPIPRDEIVRLFKVRGVFKAY
jgi:transcriptional regulator with XRE-family HTH domain